MKIFVDDIRTPSAYGYECADDYDRAVFLINYLTFDFATLDYDLGGEHTGLDILRFMHERRRYPKHLNIHSDHSKGKWLMKKYAEENFPGIVKITTNSI